MMHFICDTFLPHFDHLLVAAHELCAEVITLSVRGIVYAEVIYRYSCLRIFIGIVVEIKEEFSQIVPCFILTTATKFAY